LVNGDMEDFADLLAHGTTLEESREAAIVGKPAARRNRFIRMPRM